MAAFRAALWAEFQAEFREYAAAHGQRAGLAFARILIHLRE